MRTKDDPLSALPQNEWDSFISSILRPFLRYAKSDPLISYEDLEQEAWIALLKAAKNYDSTKSKFTTYAYHYIKGRMMRYVLENTRLSSNRIDAEPTDIEKGYIDDSLADGEILPSMLKVIADEPNVHFLIEHYVNGKSYRKIAKECGLSHQGVSMHIKHLIDLLEKRMNVENA